MPRTTITAAIAAIAAAAVVTACGPAHSNGHAAAKASTFATSAKGQQDKKTAENYLKTCIPSGGIGQVELAHQLLTSKPARKTFGDCLGVPKDQRTAFEGALLTAAEHTHWTKAGATSTFLTVTAPAIAQHYRGMR